jgi:hypothetical protein
MKKFMILVLCSACSFLSSDDEDFSYTYFELSAVQAESTGYNVTASLGLPLSLYLKASLDDKEIDLSGDLYQKSGSIVSIGTHVSIADLLKNVTKDGFSFNFARFMDFYAEVGANKWELEDVSGKTEEGTDAYLQGGIRLGDSEGWELSLYMENTKVAEVDSTEVCPISGSCYTDIDYTLSEETDSTVGIKFVNNFRENMSLSLNLDNNDSAGSTASFGIRFRL